VTYTLSKKKIPGNGAKNLLTDWQVHQFVQVVIKMVRPSIVSIWNFLYFNDAYSVYKQFLVEVAHACHQVNYNNFS